MIDRRKVLLQTVAVMAMAAGSIPHRACAAADPPPAAVGAAAPTNLQNAPTGQQAARLEEIVVTAERRSSKLQKTAIAITAVSGKQLQAQHVEQLQDLQALLPSVQMVPVSQDIQVDIRGIGSNFFDPRGETSVTSSIDGLAYTRPAQAGNTFFDVARVEVLNGPQGTLYGANAAAGAVNLITNQPGPHPDGYVEASVGNYDMRGYAAMLNIPLTDTLDIRVAGKGLFHNGYIANYYDDADSNSARASAKWTPTSDFTAYFAYNYSGSGGHGAAPVSYPCDPTPYSGFISQRCAPPGAPGGRVPLTGQLNAGLTTYQLNLSYDLGFATVTSISGYMDQSINSLNTANGTFFNETQKTTSNDFSEDLHISSTDTANHAGGLGWVVGTYYSTGGGSNQFAAPALAELEEQTKLPETTEAGFGQATYGITDFIRATAGIRYTHDLRGVDDIYGSNLRASYDHINYRVALEGDLTKQSLLYASVSTGYAAGGADGGSATAPLLRGEIPSIFKPENVLDYEVGTKNTFLDGALLVNADFYYYLIQSYQSYIPGLLNSNLLGLQIQDIANASTYGGELTAAYALTRADRFTFAGTLAQGQFGAIKFGSFGVQFGPMGPQINPLAVAVPAGYPLTNLPSWDMRLGYTHTWQLPNGASLAAGVQSHISGGYWVVAASSDPYDRQRSYTMTNVHIDYEMPHGLSIDGYINNIENAAVTTYAENPGFHLYFPMPPRTFGLTVGYHFF